MRHAEQSACSNVILVCNVSDSRAPGRATETKAMATNVQAGSATIYQFPARGRYTVSGASSVMESASVPQPASIVFGSGWDHDEAIEAERARKN